MDEAKKESPILEEETDFSYLTKLSQAYKQAQADRLKTALPEEKRTYLREMQSELTAIARFLLHYFERAEKKELAAFLLKNAENVLHCISSEGDPTLEHTVDEADFSLLTRAVLLTNRSLNAATACPNDIFHAILAEISALYALAAIA